MQVFFDNQIFQKQQQGGISRYICDLAFALAQTGKIKVIVFGGWNNNTFLDQIPRQRNLRVIYWRRSGRFKVNRFMALFLCLWRRIIFLRALRRDRQTVYHPTYFQIDTFIHKKARATVITFHDMIAEIFPRDKQARHRLSKNNAAQRAERIIAVSQATRKDLIHFYPFAEEKTHVVYHGSSLRKSLTIHQSTEPFVGKRYFLMIGERRGYKNGIMGMKAFAVLAKEYSDIDMILCGGAQEPDVEEQAIISPNNIGQRVHYLKADDMALVDLITHAVALIYLSKYEGFGLLILEAMQNGCPVITTRLGSLPEVAGEAGIYVDPDDVEAITEEMKRIMLEQDRRKKCIENCLVQAQKFSLQQMAEKTLNVYGNFFTPE